MKWPHNEALGRPLDVSFYAIHAEVLIQLLPKEEHRLLAAELLYMADRVLQKMEKHKGLRPNPDKGVLNHTAAVQTKPLPSGTRVSLSKALRSAVWTRAQGQCEYVHSGRRGAA